MGEVYGSDKVSFESVKNASTSGGHVTVTAKELSQKPGK